MTTAASRPRRRPAQYFRMAPFIFSTRKHFLKTKFSPGVLKRAYRLKPWVPSKRRRRTTDGYLLECAQKLYPKSVVGGYNSACRTKSNVHQARFIPHLSRLLKQLSPCGSTMRPVRNTSRSLRRGFESMDVPISLVRRGGIWTHCAQSCRRWASIHPF